jgi:outer membrane protein OmpA-like peptidoglycan-associated protein
MRKSALVLLLSSIGLLPAAGLAQRNPAPAPSAPTVEDYVCTFSGDCGQNEATDNQDPNAPRPRISATRGFALSGSEQQRAAPARRVGPPQIRRTARNLATSSSARTSSSSAAAAPPPASGPGQRINLAVTFVSGSAQLTPAARAAAQVFAQSLMTPQLANMRFEIDGHTDAVGRRDRNLELSQRRAQAVADFLVRAGVSADRLDVHGYGPDRPLPNVRATAPQNRRVEVIRVS